MAEVVGAALLAVLEDVLAADVLAGLADGVTGAGVLAVVEGATAVLGAPKVLAAPEASDFSPAGAALPPRKSVTYQPEPLS